MDLKAWAHGRGLSQAEFSDVLSVYAAVVMALLYLMLVLLHDILQIGRHNN